MKKVLLLYPRMLFYKVSIFNKLSDYLKDRGYSLTIWATSIDDKNHEKSFNSIDDLPISCSNYKRELSKYRYDYVVNILFKSDPGYFFYFYSLILTRIKKQPIIFYGHGINKQVDKPLSNFIYNLIYFLFDGIILYSPNEKEKLWKRHHKKITIAYNTLDIENRKELITVSKSKLREKYGITEEVIILSTGRMQSRKKIEVLFDIFITHPVEFQNIGWIIVGPDLNPELANRINTIENIHYMGAIYDTLQISEIFFISDVYAIPGALGLGILEAVYWGLPILTLDVKHGPELFYLKKNENGFLCKDEQEYLDKLLSLIKSDNLRKAFSQKSIDIYENYGKLENMFSGFKQQFERFE